MIQLKIKHMDHKAVLTVPADYERVTLALWTLVWIGTRRSIPFGSLMRSLHSPLRKNPRWYALSIPEAPL